MTSQFIFSDLLCKQTRACWAFASLLVAWSAAKIRHPEGDAAIEWTSMPNIAWLLDTCRLPKYVAMGCWGGYTAQGLK